MPEYQKLSASDTGLCEHGNFVVSCNACEEEKRIKQSRIKELSSSEYTGFDQKLRKFEELPQDLQIKKAGIVSIDVFDNLPTHGTQIETEPGGCDKEIKENQNISFDQLVLVRLFNHRIDLKNPPDMLSSGFGAKISQRETIHFALNHAVMSHAEGQWMTAETVVIIPLKDFWELNGRPKQLNSIDTYWRAEQVKIPSTAVWLTKEQEAPGGHHKDNESENIIKWDGKAPVEFAVSAILQKLGYTTIIGSDKYDQNGLNKALRNFRKKEGLPAPELHSFTEDPWLDSLNLFEFVLWQKKNNPNFSLNDDYIIELKDAIDGLRPISKLDPEKQKKIFTAVNEFYKDSKLFDSKQSSEEEQYLEFAFFQKLDDYIRDLKISKKSGKEFANNPEAKVIQNLDDGILERFVNKFLALPPTSRYGFIYHRRYQFGVGFENFVDDKDELLKEWDDKDLMQKEQNEAKEIIEQIKNGLNNNNENKLPHL